MNSNTQRNITVDLLRCIAIVLMVVFHFIFDLKMFGLHQWDIPDGAGWREFRYVILSLFFLCVGVGLVFAHGPVIRWRLFFWRELTLVAGAVAISLASWILARDQWIYFGVLHFIAVASLVSLPLVNHPRLALVAALVMLLGATILDWPHAWPLSYLVAAWPEWFPDYTADWVPLIPWLALVWVGIALAHSPALLRDPAARLRISAKLLWPGRHSLLVYLVHQPILMGAIYLALQLA
ncbi:DUF1624 domain-containing protein [Simiduia sp. 21SJ11W-1]|uniref:heparan-alpha-glucosaminide N-acetyltransferase n=1 Tax=Simiduia sp. 21SJ11W-1 TaxID=2909669 RepID=UPI00209C7AAA|nr:heparan-alpha-glucosaminide N-acetyltransferase [Simiduia sp. 21SJ11W-1]UTA47114.1 DUF1624 domain-containing protein [Simiduia sp. 21SJ11W-1]